MLKLLQLDILSGGHPKKEKFLSSMDCMVIDL